MGVGSGWGGSYKIKFKKTEACAPGSDTASADRGSAQQRRESGARLEPGGSARCSASLGRESGGEAAEAKPSLARASLQTPGDGWLPHQSTHPHLGWSGCSATGWRVWGRCPRCCQSRVGSRCGSSAWDPTSPGRAAKGCRELPPHIVTCTSGCPAELPHSKHSQPRWILLHLIYPCGTELGSSQSNCGC